MSATTAAFLSYACCFLVALALLYFSGPKAWYWHLFSLLAALGIGFVPIPKQWNTPQMGVIVGSCFVFLFFWGAGALFFLRRRRS